MRHPLSPWPWLDPALPQGFTIFYRPFGQDLHPLMEKHPQTHVLILHHQLDALAQTMPQEIPLGNVLFINATQPVDIAPEFLPEEGCFRPGFISLTQGIMGQPMHDIHHRHFPGTAHFTGITGGAQHDGLTAKHLFPLTSPDQGENLSGRKIHFLFQGAGSGTNPTLHTHLISSPSLPFDIPPGQRTDHRLFPNRP